MEIYDNIGESYAKQNLSDVKRLITVMCRNSYANIKDIVGKVLSPENLMSLGYRDHG